MSPCPGNQTQRVRLSATSEFRNRPVSYWHPLLLWACLAFQEGKAAAASDGEDDAPDQALYLTAPVLAGPTFWVGVDARVTAIQRLQ